MDDSSLDSRGARFIERRVERKGLRPRFAAAIIAVVWLIAIAIFGVVEHLVEPDTFDTVWLGLWWATQTVTTVGYGDTVPADTAGQAIAAILMVGGLSLFAVITGTITSAFVTRAQARMRAGGDDPLMEKIDQLTAELESIRAELGRLADSESPAPG